MYDITKEKKEMEDGYITKEEVSLRKEKENFFIIFLVFFLSS